MDHDIFLAQGKSRISLLGKMANRHGVIAGATGTGKSVSLRVLAEGFSAMGVPVFLADVKGDLAGMAFAGGGDERIEKRRADLQLASEPYRGFPVRFWDVFGEQGHPVRITVTDLGPMLLARLFELNETQTDVLALVFKIADDNGLALLDLKDLQAMLQFTAENSSRFTLEYGNIATATIGAIQRRVVALGDQGADRFFGEPALDVVDILQLDEQGQGYINILAADKLMLSPKAYSVFLLWLLAELFEKLPEAGDREKPKCVLFFDEAHLLFDEAPKALLRQIETVVRLIRSKSVGVYFISQSTSDMPDDVLGQLGNRVQHALRAFTPKDQKVVRAAAETFRTDESFDTEAAILELGVGEALVSLLDASGTPTFAERALIRPPLSRLGPVSTAERKTLIQSCSLHSKYAETVDRESAYEVLKKKAHASQPKAEVSESEPAEDREPRVLEDRPAPAKAPGRTRQGPIEAFVVSTVRAVGSQVGRQLVRGVLGSLLGGRRR